MKKLLCVVIDANIWHSTVLLKSLVAAEFVYSLARQGAKIGLPEVLEEEIRIRAAEIGQESARVVEKAGRTLHLLTNGQIDVCFNPEPDFSRFANERFEELTNMIVRDPLTLEQARSAIAMAQRKMPPCAKSQQVKDAAIWHSILTLGSKYKVIFITNDNAFYKSNESNALATTLQIDCDQKDVELLLYRDISTCFDTLRSDSPKLDEDWLKRVIGEAVRPRLATEAERYKHEIGEIKTTRFRAFKTADEQRVAIDFKCIFEFTGPNAWIVAQKPCECNAVAVGSCYLDIRRRTLLNMVIEMFEFEKLDEPAGRSRHTRSTGEVDLGLPIAMRIAIEGD